MSSSASSIRAYQGSAPSSPSSSNNPSRTSSSNTQALLSSQRIAAYLATSVQAQPPCRMHHVVPNNDQAAMNRTQTLMDELEEMMAQYAR